MHLLIPYVHSIPPDPVFDEYTYGDHGQRARKLKFEVNKGDYIFFHASRGSKKFITAYYVVDRVIDTVQAAQDREVSRKYKNPHIVECLKGKRPKPDDDDAIIFGDPILSFILPKPLPFSKQLAGKLSLNIHFPQNKSEIQAIGSATRAWRQLTADDVEILLEEIDNFSKNQLTIKSLMSTEEVSETLEKDIEDYIANHPELIGEHLVLVGRQIPIETGRIDLLFEDDKNHKVVIEVKFNRVGRDALRQTKDYVKELAEKESKNMVTGVLVCAGVMPAYEEEIQKQSEVKILVYGWELKVQNWQNFTTYPTSG